MTKQLILLCVLLQMSVICRADGWYKDLVIDIDNNLPSAVYIAAPGEHIIVAGADRRKPLMGADLPTENGRLLMKFSWYPHEPASMVLYIERSIENANEISVAEQVADLQKSGTFFNKNKVIRVIINDDKSLSVKQGGE